MKIYRNLSGDSGVLAYELGPGYIIVQFRQGMCYEYTNASAGTRHVQEMQALAAAGRGLGSYIKRYVNNGYARKFRC